MRDLRRDRARCAARGLASRPGRRWARSRATASGRPASGSCGTQGTIRRLDTLVPAPDLHGRARIPHQRGHGTAAAAGDAIRLVRRARRRRAAAGLRRVVVPLRIEPLGTERDVAVGAERAAGTGEMGVGEEVAEPGVREMLLDAAPPLLARAIRALRQPAALRRDPEQTTVLVLAHRQLQPDALVAAEERQVPVRGRGPDDLEAALLLETAEGGYQVLVDLP